MSKPFTKIIAGKYKGKALELPFLDVTRSSKSILKGSVFDSLQFDIIDKVFVEAFAGSGSMGLEALSRGASKAVFIEKDRLSYNVLNKNCKFIDANSCTTILGDAFIQIPNIAKNLSNLQNQVIFYFDPPFSYRENMEEIYEKCFELTEQISKSQTFLIIFEHMSQLKMPQILGEFELNKTRKFGKSSLSYYA